MLGLIRLTPRSATRSRPSNSTRTGKVRVYRARLVVEEVEDSATQMTLEDARTHQADAEVGDTVETEQLDQDWEGARLSGPARGGGGRGLRHANDARGCSDSSG